MDKIECRNLTNAAIKRGDLVRGEVCEKCGETDSIQCHHPDYENPLDVKWLCIGCHAKEHREEKQERHNPDKPEFHCNHCQHTWTGRKKTPPVICPRCKQPKVIAK